MNLNFVVNCLLFQAGETLDLSEYRIRSRISLSPPESPVASEAMYLMMKHVFELGYRRYEWKCDSCNAPSRQAAQRFGFSYEGVFRQATLYKGRNRDTAWYSILDREWPVARAAFEAWLDPANFAADGSQRQRLSALMQPGLKALRV